MIKMLQYKMYPAGELRCPTTALVFFGKFYVDLYHNYQIYLDFAHTTHKSLLSLFMSKSTDRMANSVDLDQLFL